MREFVLQAHDIIEIVNPKANGFGYRWVVDEFQGDVHSQGFFPVPIPIHVDLSRRKSIQCYRFKPETYKLWNRFGEVMRVWVDVDDIQVVAKFKTLEFKFGIGDLVESINIDNNMKNDTYFAEYFVGIVYRIMDRRWRPCVINGQMSYFEDYKCRIVGFRENHSHKEYITLNNELDVGKMERIYKWYVKPTVEQGEYNFIWNHVENLALINVQSAV